MSIACVCHTVEDCTTKRNILIYIVYGSTTPDRSPPRLRTSRTSVGNDPRGKRLRPHEMRRLQLQKTKALGSPIRSGMTEGRKDRRGKGGIKKSTLRVEPQRGLEFRPSPQPSPARGEGRGWRGDVCRVLFFLEVHPELGIAPGLFGSTSTSTSRLIKARTRQEDAAADLPSHVVPRRKEVGVEPRRFPLRFHQKKAPLALAQPWAV